MTLQEQVAQLQKENAALKASQPKPKAISFKVSEKGALSVYGLGRFPVTLYRSQWNRLLDKADDIKLFIIENQTQLKIKE